MLFSRILEFYAQLVVGFAVSESPESVLTAKALQITYQSRIKPSDVLFHSDQETHYTRKKFAESLGSCEGITQSMSRRGNCRNKAPTERLFKSFKTENMPKGGYENIAEAIIKM